MDAEGEDGRFDMRITEKERRTFSVMAVLLLSGALLLVVLTATHPAGHWDHLRYYCGGVAAGGAAGMAFIWFVNTDGIMVSASSLGMLAVTVGGFGIVLVSAVQLLLVPDLFSGTALMLGLGLSTSVFALGI